MVIDSYQYSQPIFLSGMKTKPLQTPSPPASSALLTHRFEAPVFVGSPLNCSNKKSSRSAYLTDRSSSRHKVMIPHSPKLANFFSSSRPLSSHKSFSTTSTEDLATRRVLPAQHDPPSKKAEFLKQNINRDYFDEITEQNLKERAQPRKEPLLKNGQPAGRALFLRDAARREGDRQLNREISYKSETLIRPQKPLDLAKVAQPQPKQLPHKVFIKPIQKLHSPKEKAKGGKADRYESNRCQDLQKTRVQNSLEYTFGLNY